MVYTDYFVKGHQPTTMCPLHPVPNGYATTLSAGVQPQAIPGTPALPVAAPRRRSVPPALRRSAEAPSHPADQTPKKKRGFWGRIFGRGGGG